MLTSGGATLAELSAIAQRDDENFLLLQLFGAALFSQLTQPHHCIELMAGVPGISLNTVKQFVSLLLRIQMLPEVHEDGTIQEQINPTLAQWEFHDLLFHSRSRIVRHANPAGGTYRFNGKIEPLPALKAQISEQVILLYEVPVKMGWLPALLTEEQLNPISMFF